MPADSPPPTPGGPSRRRYAQFLEERRRDAAAGMSSAKKPTEAASESAGAAPPPRWLLEPKDKLKRGKTQRSAWTLLKSFLALFAQRKRVIIAALLTVVLGQAIALVQPLFVKFIVDHVLSVSTSNPAPLPDWLPTWVPRNPVTLLYYTGGAMVFVAAVSALIAIGGRYQMTRLTNLTRVRLRRSLFNHMARLPLHTIQSVKSGGVSSILREDAQSVGDMLFTVVYNPVKGLVTFLGGLTIMAMLDWRLLIGGLLMIPAIWYTHRTWIGRIRPIYSSIKNTRQHADAHATEVFSGIRVVRTFSRLRSESTRFAVNNDLVSRKEMLVWWWSRGIEVIWSVLVPLASAAVIVYGGMRVLDHKLTIGDVMAFSTVILMLLGPMELLVGTASQLQNALAAWDRCLDILAEPTEFDSPPRRGGAGGGVPASALLPLPEGGGGGWVHDRAIAHGFPGTISLSNLCFTYPNSKQEVLHDINLTVRAGQTVALVGPSGSGKTTLCNLIARFYDPSSGSITLGGTTVGGTNLRAVGGTDLRAVPVDTYRAMLAIVEQDVFLFDGTIADNISYGKRHASMDQIIAAANAANAHGFITSFEKGYNTTIGERGVRLSGGQKQRIAIARALLADPRILILDEATSNLDSESEALIQRALVDLMRGRTCFVIAHRLSTIRHADLIVVLENGRITETGTHDELMRKGGRYLRMVQAQVDPAGIERDLDG